MTSLASAKLVPNFVLFKTLTGKINIEVYFQDETLWLTQKKMAELFEVDRTVITKHIKNIFETKELSEHSVCANIAHTANDGKTYQTKHYNLNAIIAVGYRINSAMATQFRVRATTILHEYIITTASPKTSSSNLISIYSWQI